MPKKKKKSREFNLALDLEINSASLTRSGRKFAAAPSLVSVIESPMSLPTVTSTAFGLTVSPITVSGKESAAS